MMRSKIDLSVIIVNFNTKELLRQCLNSLIDSNKSSNKFVYEVIVVDNGSTDGSVEEVKSQKPASPAGGSKVKSHNPKLKIILNKKNLGFAAANNQGIKIAKGDYILLLNSDTVLKDNPLPKLVEFARKHPRAGVVGPRLLNQDGSHQPSTAPFFTLFNAFLWLFTGDRFLYSSPLKACQVDWVMGSAFLIKKKVIDQVGLLDEQFFMYVEEQEWCYRMKKAGWQVWFYPGAEIFHLVRGSSPEGRQKAVWWIYEGLIYFYQKHFASWQLFVLKLLLKIKAGMAWALGWMAGSQYLKKTYAKAFKMAG